MRADLAWSWVSPRYRMHRNPLLAERSKGGWVTASLSKPYAGSFQPPPRMNRCPSRVLLFQHHSRTFPAMSEVPNGPAPW